MGIKKYKDRAREPVVKAIDLFCGVGGLTRGMEKAGIDVRLGVDIDPTCAYPYEANNEASFLLKSVADLNASELLATTKGDGFTLLAGCAPCQPFSTYRQKSGPSDERWHLLGHFGRLAKEIEPELITMENVPNLAKQSVFTKFVSRSHEKEARSSRYNVSNTLKMFRPKRARIFAWTFLPKTNAEKAPLGGYTKGPAG
jgi:DNA (cytosine-5)-methyltransferase 1